MSSILGVGELAAVATAISWTASSVAFAVSSRRTGGLAVNQFRLLVALPVIYALAWLATGEAWPHAIPGDRVRLLLLSGVIGFVLGDALFFHALTWLGPRLTSVLFATWPAMATALALLLAGEVPSLPIVVGVLVTMVGVVLVLLRGGDAGWNPAATRRHQLGGVLAAFGGALGQAVGAVLARQAMLAGADLQDGVPPIVATMLRLLAALPVLLLCTALLGQPLAALRVLRDAVSLRAALLGTGFGPVCGVLLSMVALRHATSTGLAAALMATTPLFMMPVSAWFYGVRIGWRGVAGTVLAVGGVAVLLLAR